MPRSRLSVFVPTPRSSLLVTEPSASSVSLVSHSCRTTPSRLDSSRLKNGSVISNLVTYAESIRDTVEKAIVSQQISIASKLGEIVVSLGVLPGLVQKISSHETNVDSLEALLSERTSQLDASAKECQLLREQLDKYTNVVETKIVALENCLSSAISSLCDKPVLQKNVQKDAGLSVSSPPSSGSMSISLGTLNSENVEVLLTNFVNNKNCNSKLVALTAFRAVLDTISLEDIISCRSSVTKEQQGSSASTSNTGPSPFLCDCGRR